MESMGWLQDFLAGYGLVVLTAAFLLVLALLVCETGAKETAEKAYDATGDDDDVTNGDGEYDSGDEEDEKTRLEQLRREHEQRVVRKSPNKKRCAALLSLVSSRQSRARAWTSSQCAFRALSKLVGQ
jgi:hypothetical protein